ncbi:MAG: siroheme synthase [Arcobacter sp.]|nr:MAG: siroheme synthase [Arcobacter sp.]
MGYFPAFLQLNDKKVLLVGGGNIAFEKLERLLDFTTEVKVIALEVNTQMQELIDKKGLKLECRAYEKGDIKDYAIVVVAVDDISLQAEIFEESKSYKCLCNAVDSVDYCDFIFPSYIKENDLTIAISTSGSSPAFAKHLKYYIKNLIPSNISEFLQEMKGLRKILPKGKERMKMLDKKAQDYIQGWKNV